MATPQLLIALALALGVVAFVVWPMLDRGASAVAARPVDLDRVEQRILEYRQALRRRTVCEDCLYANPAASRFCAQCGTRLAAVATGSQATLDPS